MQTGAWSLDPSVLFLNHGSFGACPRPILDEQSRWRARMEAEPVRFLARELEGLLEGARRALGAFVGAAADDLALVPNATAGVNAVVGSLAADGALAAGDELVITDHAYNACRNVLAVAAARTGARVVTARVPWPLGSPDEVLDAVLCAVGERTRLVLIDHVTSPTGLVFPVERLVGALAARGIDALVDGAHAPGMVPLDLDKLGAAYYVGNCHKWMCAPKGAGFLHVRRDRQARIRPTVISHGANSPRADRSRFRLEFDWMGTVDPSPWLCLPACIELLGAQVSGGWPALMARNRALALAARRTLCERLDMAPPAPDEMIGSLAALPLPDDHRAAGPSEPLSGDPLQTTLFDAHRIEAYVLPWPAPPRRLIRVSAQLYNEPADYARLADVLAELLP
jgi:isopenicillin-N epimerase